MSTYDCNLKGFVRQGVPIASLIEDKPNECRMECDANSKCTHYYTTKENPDDDVNRCLLIDGMQTNGKILDMAYMPKGDTFCQKLSYKTQSIPLTPSTPSNPSNPSFPSTASPKEVIGDSTLFYILMGVLGGSAILALIVMILYTWKKQRGMRGIVGSMKAKP